MYLSPATNINFFFFSRLLQFLFLYLTMWKRGDGSGGAWFLFPLVPERDSWGCCWTEKSQLPQPWLLTYQRQLRLTSSHPCFSGSPQVTKWRQWWEASDDVWRTALRPRYIPNPACVLQNPLFHFNPSEDRIRPWQVAEYEKYIYCAFCPMYPLVLLAYNNMEIKIHCVCKIGFPTNSIALKIKIRFPG